MRIDKKKLESMLNLPDDELWAEIVRLGSGYGFTLPKETPSKEKLACLRSTAKGDRINAGEALKLLNSIRKGAK